MELKILSSAHMLKDWLCSSLRPCKGSCQQHGRIRALIVRDALACSCHDVGTNLPARTKLSADTPQPEKQIRASKFLRAETKQSASPESTYLDLGYVLPLEGPK